MLSTRREWLFIVLAGFFITNAVTAELISNKLVDIPIGINLLGLKVDKFVTVMGVLPWPVVFIVTDLLNEFYGKAAVRRLSWITAGLIAYCFLLVIIALAIPANTTITPFTANDYEFNKVFGQSRWVIVGSIFAFLFSQLLDAALFAKIKARTGNRMIWLRSTGSTVVSQLIDSYIVLYIGFVLPGTMTFAEYMKVAPVNYLLKLFIALALTPLIYLGHAGIRRYLAKDHVPQNAQSPGQ
ncbi:MAG: queuosine precursor transporter [Flavobacteriales bacterium]|nr:queuosine precursor transporter [Flavobacteriales bacterium]